jgi:hypothetical protein
MNAMDRRSFLRTSLGGVAAVTVSIAFIPDAAEALPLALDKMPNIPKTDSLVEKAQRRRRWACWWRRGRRICGWRTW